MFANELAQSATNISILFETSKKKSENFLNSFRTISVLRTCQCNSTNLYLPHVVFCVAVEVRFLGDAVGLQELADVRFDIGGDRTGAVAVAVIARAGKMTDEVGLDDTLLSAWHVVVEPRETDGHPAGLVIAVGGTLLRLHQRIVEVDAVCGETVLWHVMAEGRTHLQLTRLAAYCCEAGLEMAVAQRQVLFSLTLGKDAELVRKVFENAYREVNDEKYRKRRNIVKPLKNIPPETLLTMKIDVFLNENYELRKNVMRGVAEYRQRTGHGFDFQDLTEEARNSITMRALSQGIKCWDKDIRRYVNSNDITPYDPMNDFLDHLPKWDGKDRVEPLARRIQCDYPEWPHLFHIWMRSMVAMWRGKGQLTGNALVPLLIGRQGCGKTSFCRILLPREQRDYYNDRINFKNESDLNLGLTSFALINLDEFDKITQRQQIVLKYLVSTSDLKYRPPYGKAYSSHRRYASFIGTTNEMMPLTDPSGSRRFICVTVEGDVDFTTPVDYPQLYAQLEHEVSTLGLRYCLTKDEEHALMRHNLQYQKLSGLGEMLMSLFQKPEATSETDPQGGVWLSLKDISARLKKTFKGGYKEDEGSFIKIGNYLSRPEYKFESRRMNYGVEYWVKERE